MSATQQEDISTYRQSSLAASDFEQCLFNFATAVYGNHN